MYESFYGLSERPFNLTPDPRFLFLSDKHKEAFAHLTYGIDRRSGFVMISGEIGTGKTTICRSLLSQLDDDTEVAFIFNPYLSPEELLRKINEDFGIDSRARTVKSLIDELNVYLLKSAGEGKNCVLVIDEAQNLDPPVLEQIRLLSNLETEKQKLLQIVLIGQPELAEKLELPELRQLNQRITARYHLKALNFDETIQYVAFRLRTAGGRRKVRFSRSATRAIYRHSKGTPRVINSVCDRALLVGYTKEVHEITRAIVRQAAREIQGERRAQRRRRIALLLSKRSPYYITAVAAVIALLLVTGVPFWSLPRGASEDGATRARDAESPNPPAERHLVRASDDGSTVAAAVPDPSTRALAGPSAENDERKDAVTMASVDRKTLAVPDPGGPPAMPRSELDELLSGVLSADAHGDALMAILRAWNMAQLAELPGNDSVRSTARWAASVELSFEPLTPTLDELLTINLPALVQMRTSGGARWLTLFGAEEDTVEVTVAGGETRHISNKDFKALYTGKALLLWLDPVPSARVLRLRDRGAGVRALQDGLKRLGLFSGRASGRYDDRTAETIRQFQLVSGLLVDGVVGKQTRMLLTSWLRETPSLANEAFPAHARERAEAALEMKGLLFMEDQTAAKSFSESAGSALARVGGLAPQVQMKELDRSGAGEASAPVFEAPQGAVTAPASRGLPLVPHAQGDSIP